MSSSNNPPASGDYDQVGSVRRRPSPNPGPSDPATPILRTSFERLSQDAADRSDEPRKPEARTVLYLAYGSNLCSETFRGVRGIRPLSQVNVSVPTLRLTLGLPGLPYKEPCFANVDFRKLPDLPKVPPFTPPQYPETEWDGGLMGVVYEVTHEDYRNIMRTEGGGSGYKEIHVPCLPIPPRVAVPEKPPFPELPRPFLARTLCAPQIPQDGQPGDPGKDGWWHRFMTRPMRPDPDYAQASARYLKLLRDGAREHELPDVYQEYLASLQPYVITSWRQQIGMVLFICTSFPAFLVLVAIGKVLADKDGKYPPLMSNAMTVMFNVVWMAYDYIFKPIFGDGERTEGSESGDDVRRCRRLSLGHPIPDEEKRSLLEVEE